VGKSTILTGPWLQWRYVRNCQRVRNSDGIFHENHPKLAWGTFMDWKPPCFIGLFFRAKFQGKAPEIWVLKFPAIPLPFTKLLFGAINHIKSSQNPSHRGRRTLQLYKDGLWLWVYQVYHITWEILPEHQFSKKTWDFTLTKELGFELLK
jgi:hypothetical protein